MSDMSSLNERNEKYSGADLKRIALISMTLDHFGALVIEPFLGLGPNLSLFDSKVFYIDILYYVLRLIGRLAFMIYAHGLVEGFLHTRNRKRYLFLLGMFALISQPFFSKALRHTWWSFDYLNIFFTLTFGLLMLFVLERLKNQETWISYLIVLGFALISYLLNMDWNWLGIMMIAVLYHFREQPDYRNLGLILLGSLQITAPLAVLFINNYNGTRGRVSKYVHYVYYPLHLWIFSLIAQALH